jgi:hypothetical protein
MKNVALALLIALGLAAAFVGFASKSQAGCDGSFADEPSDTTRP